MAAFEWPIRVYYEDTDAGGIVYYANYLKFMERARSELLRAKGLDQVALRDDLGVLLVVRHVEADYRKSALYDDELTVKTEFLAMKNASFVLKQDVWRGDELLFEGKVVIVAMTLERRSTRIPAEIRAKFEVV